MTCVLGLLLSILATLIPSLIAIAILWWLDRYEKEPLWLLSIAFFWGAVPTIIMSLVAQLLIDRPLAAILGHSVFYPLTNMSLVAPLTEETFKGLIILAIFLFYRTEFDGVMDGILYGALVGFGFSIVEDVFYLMGSLMEGGWGNWGVTVALRVGLYNLNHSLFTACTGVGFGLARNTRQWWQKLLFPIAGWIVAMILHGLHNGGTVLAEATSGLSCVLLTAVDWMGVVGMLVLIWFVVRRERKWLDELLPELQLGTITPYEYRIASVYRDRVAQGWRVLTRQGPLTWLRWNRYVQAIVDLAYKKHQKQAAGEGAATDRLIADLRQRIARARLELPHMGGET
jgi:RsiW-degrading membrane proteinase PrsW (M82 family)